MKLFLSKTSFSSLIFNIILSSIYLAKLCSHHRLMEHCGIRNLIKNKFSCFDRFFNHKWICLLIRNSEQLLQYLGHIPHRSTSLVHYSRFEHKHKDEIGLLIKEIKLQMNEKQTKKKLKDDDRNENQCDVICVMAIWGFDAVCLSTAIHKPKLYAK